jgi:hypothetical protein
MIVGRATTRLPGIRFEAQAPPLAEALPRMDIAFFVGFAASGPLHTPVAVESAAQFAATFGDDAPLAWDERRGATLQAHLAPAVRAFFRNGGQRCWVVRVARQRASGSNPLDRARANYFPIPGMARAAFTPDGKTITRITPAFARARSEGSWSDALRVSATLETRPLQGAGEVRKNGGDLTVEFERVAPNDLAIGDLLRLSFGQENLTLLLVISDVEFGAGSPPSNRRARIIGRQTLWFRPITEESPLSSTREVTAMIYTRETLPSPIDTFDANQSASLISGFERICEAEFQVLPGEQGGGPVAHLKLRDVSGPDALAPGSLARVDVNGGQLWLTIDEQGISQDGAVTIRGQGMWHVEEPPILPPAAPAAERLSFDLWARLQEKYASSLTGLAFADSQERFWGSQLPSDDEFFRSANQAETPGSVLRNLPGRPQAPDLFRFPLAGLSGEREVCFPLGMRTLPVDFLGAVILPGSELERDGLAVFDADLFLDEDLTDARNEALISQADFIRYLSPAPRELRGIHAAMGVEEATIIAAPDTVHTGWSKREAKQPPEPLPSVPPPRPEWLGSLPCRPELKEQDHTLRDCEQSVDESLKENDAPPREPMWENFLDCSIRVVTPPVLSINAPINNSGAFDLLWTPSTAPDAEEIAEYTLEESVSRDFAGAEAIYTGKETRQSIIGRQPGNYYYRVKAKIGRNVSDWSNGVVAQIDPASGWAVKAAGEYSPRSLFNVQRALLRMCAARGDMFAALSLPEHYRREKIVEHLQALRSEAPSSLIDGVAPEPLDDRTLSFGAVWHPWLSGREENRFDQIRSAPPCGAISGVMAKRALSRGAWVAPANDPLREVIALTAPILSDERLELQEERLNLIRREPRGFLSLGSDTLSDDADLRQINVRRLLSLLRRLALKLGATYVFEPHSQVFQRSVKRGFEAMLDRMFTLGAFAGATPATSYQVVVDQSLNTPQSMEQGRFIVELRVAPSLPLRFLTVRLVHNGDRGFVQEF